MKKSVINICIGILVTLMATSVYAVTPKHTPATPVSSQAVPATETVMVPKTAVYGNSTIPGDSAVLNDVAALHEIQEEYNKKETVLVEQFQPSWKAAQEKFIADVATVKAVNGWGEDVDYDIQSKQWVKSKRSTNKK
jgi:hypothetical protein